MTRKRSRTVLRGESGGNTADLLDSIENIHKVINPLFLDDLKKDLESILEIKVAKTRLSRLENKALRAIYDGQKMFNLEGLIKVGIHQFYGIEINDFAVTVAKQRCGLPKVK